MIAKTSKHVDGHYHVVYLPEDGRPILTSVNDGHSHELEFVADLGRYEIKASNIDGHSHVVEDYEVELDFANEEEKDSDIVNDVWQCFREGIDIESESAEVAAEAEDFYWGEQWDSAMKADLEKKGRCALTINRIETMVDGLTGLERQERTELRFLPEEGGDQRVADALNHLVKHLLEKGNYHREKSKVFEDTVIIGRGLFNVYVDFSRDIRGEIKIERYPWSDVVFGPHEKEDLEDCEWLVKHKMYSRDKLRMMYPDAEDQIDKMFVYETFPDDNARNSNFLNNTNSYSFPVVTFGKANIDILRKELRVLELWRRIYKIVPVVVAIEDNFYVTADAWARKDVAALRTIPGISVVERQRTYMRVSKVAGSVLLSDENPANLPVDDFFIVPIYAKKRGRRWKGKVSSAIDPQREVNKRHSQAIDIGNQAGYGWFYDDTTFPDKRAEMEFQDNISAPNFKLRISALSQPPLKQDGVKFPSEIVQLMQISDQSLTTTLSTEVQSAGANEGGSKFLERKKQAMTPNEFLFDNLAFGQKKLGKLIVSLIQRYYTPERAARVLGSIPNKEEATIGGTAVSGYSQEEIVSLLSTADLLEYDVSVGESAYSPTARLGTYMRLNEMASSGAPIPPELLVELMDIPQDLKKKISDVFAQQSQGAAQEQSEKAKMEINKTLIAQGIIPPEIKAQLASQGGQVGEQPGEAIPQPEEQIVSPAIGS